MLQSWYQPVLSSVWSEHKVFERLRNLLLVPEQQSSVDSGVRVDQWALSNSRSQQPFNAMCKRLITRQPPSSWPIGISSRITTLTSSKLPPQQLREPSFPSG